MALSIQIEYVIRIIAAALCGAIVGSEREKRQKSAGIRTHVIVAMASALMMIVSKYGFFDVLSGDAIKLDPSRVASGVVSAIGFLGAGIIFVRQGSAIGVTTAAGLWATVAIGLAMGAGMYGISFISTLFIEVVHMILHSKSLSFTRNIDAYIKVNMTRQNLNTVCELKDFLEAKGIRFRTYKIENKDGDYIFSALIQLSVKKGASLDSIISDVFYEEFRVL